MKTPWGAFLMGIILIPSVLWAEPVFKPSDPQKCLLPIGYMNGGNEFRSGNLSSLVFKAPPPAAGIQPGPARSWSLVTEGNEVYSREYLASALPEGHRCWNQILNWSIQSKDFFEERKSFLGNTKWRFDFRVMVAFGQFNSRKRVANQWKTIQGSYVGFVTVIPTATAATSKKDLNAEVRVLGVYNSGDQDAPKATVDLLISYEVSGEKISRVVQVDGQGHIEWVKD